MARVALISDIHSNLLALRAALDAIARTGVDEMICLGDVANLGPEPNAVIETLAELACPCIMGNHDEFLLKPELVLSYNEAPAIVASVEWSRNRLSSAELDFVRGFERERKIALSGGTTLHVFHGSPRSNTEDLLTTTPPELLDEMLADTAATVMAGGHTHLQMLRQHHGRLLVNPGSVGLAFKDYVNGARPTILSHAEFAIVEARDGAVEVSLRRVALDRDKLREASRQSDHPLREFHLQQYS